MEESKGASKAEAGLDKQLEDINVAITKVEGKIQKLEDKLENVEDKEEKQYLREKEKQLREKEKQLREEKILLLKQQTSRPSTGRTRQPIARHSRARGRNADSFESGDSPAHLDSDSGSISSSQSEVFSPSGGESQGINRRHMSGRSKANSTRTTRNARKKAQIIHFLTHHCSFQQSEAQRALTAATNSETCGFDLFYRVLKRRRNTKMEFKMSCQGFATQFRAMKEEYLASLEMREDVVKMLDNLEF